MRKIISVVFLVFFMVFGGLTARVDDTTVTPRKTGRFEVAVHYSLWNINMLSGLIEDSFVPDIEDYNEDLAEYVFDSSGSNYGIEFRFFPGGRNGSFSMGLSYERNHFDATLVGTYVEEELESRTRGDVRGELELRPHSFNLNLRWELWASARIHPYIGFGFGIGAMEGLATFKGEVVTTHGDMSTEIEGIDEEYTLKELLEDDEEEEFPLNFIPLVQMQLGLRAQLTPGVYLTLETSIWNGIIYRGGLAVRF